MPYVNRFDTEAPAPQIATASGTTSHYGVETCP